MSILCAKISDSVTIVHVDDPDVTCELRGHEGWVPREFARVEPGATVLGVGPLGTQKQFRAAARHELGDRIYHVAKHAVQKIGEWRDKGGKQRLSLVDADDESVRELLDDMPLPAAFQLYKFAESLTVGRDPMEECAEEKAAQDEAQDPRQSSVPHPCPPAEGICKP